MFDRCDVEDDTGRIAVFALVFWAMANVFYLSVIFAAGILDRRTRLIHVLDEETKMMIMLFQ